jgi:hypothetical protein
VDRCLCCTGLGDLDHPSRAVVSRNALTHAAELFSDSSETADATQHTSGPRGDAASAAIHSLGWAIPWWKQPDASTDGGIWLLTVVKLTRISGALQAFRGGFRDAEDTTAVFP